MLEELLPEEYTRPVTLAAYHAVTVPKSLGGELRRRADPLGSLAM